MQKPGKLLLLLPLCVALACVAALILRSLHPSSTTREVNALLWKLTSSSPEDRHKSAEGFRKLGKAALPQLIAILTPPPTIKSKLIQWVRPLRGTPFARFVPGQLLWPSSEFPPTMAVGAFVLLGQQAAPAIPALERIARNPKSTANAVRALVAIGTNTLPIVDRLATNSPTSDPAIFGLVRMAEIGFPTDAIVADLSKSHIGRQNLERAAALPPAQAIRILTNALQNPDPQIRQTAAQCMLRQKDTPEATLAIPALERCTYDPDTEVQTAAALTLRALYPEDSIANTGEN